MRMQLFSNIFYDFITKTRVYFLKHKPDAFECFQQFKTLVEKQSSYYIKVLKASRGGEYISNDSLKFCKSHGIHKQFTWRYTPQQNCVAKRKNITIMEMVHNMMETKHLASEYWAHTGRKKFIHQEQILLQGLKNRCKRSCGLM